jgi:stage II sporulation protein AA (anti-sigma F factor antagonist)
VEGVAVFEVGVATDAGQVVVEVAGDVDMLTAGQLRNALTEAVRVAGTGPVVVDLSRVRFLDSSGVQVLVDGYHTAMVAGGTLTIRGASGTAARVLHIVGLAQILDVDPLPEEPMPPELELPGPG